MITAWVLRRTGHRVTVWTMAAARMWLMLMLVIGGSIPLGMMRDGNLHMDRGEIGVYVMGGGIEWSTDRPTRLDTWKAPMTGALRMRGNGS